MAGKKNSLDRLEVTGFKSIGDLDLKLQDVNVLIGPNGAGKSNLIAFFRLLNQLIRGQLQMHVAKGGGADAFLFYGSKETPRLTAKMHFGRNAYAIALEPSADDALVFSKEQLIFKGVYFDSRQSLDLGTGHRESKAREKLEELGSGSIPDYVVPSIESWKVYHFHDTSVSAPVKKTGDLHDNQYLRPDASNLAAFLYYLRKRHRSRYERVRETAQEVVPPFDDFLLKPEALNEEKIRLRWTEKSSDYPFQADQFSDGSLRFICLATLLLQPRLPSTVLIDEPELGLHSSALTLLGDLIREAARRTQVIVSTQSVPFLNAFKPEEVITVERQTRPAGDGVAGGSPAGRAESVFERHSEGELAYWLDQYSLAEVWEKNVIGGRP